MAESEIDAFLKNLAVSTACYAETIEDAGLSQDRLQPLLAYCDMTTDDGGWTLYAIGSHLSGVADQPTVTGPGNQSPRTLRQDRAEALAAVATKLFRISNASRTQSFFILDRAPLFASGQQGGFGRGHIWASDSGAVACATSYAQVKASTMVTTDAFAISCESKGPGSHICGSIHGWILFHSGAPMTSTDGIPAASAADRRTGWFSAGFGGSSAPVFRVRIGHG